MATVNYFVSAKKRKIAPVYIRLSAGRGTDLIVKSGLMVNPANWSSKTQSIKQRIRTSEEEEFINKLKGLKTEIEEKVKSYGLELTKSWLEGIVYQFHNRKEQGAKTLNEYIEQHITEIEEGKRQGKRGRNISQSMAKSLRTFQRIFNEYQGIYTPKVLQKLTDEKKKPRRLKTVDYEDITVDFGNSFKNFLVEEGYKVNTVGKQLKLLKYIMSKALADKKHNNKEFKEAAFPSMSEETFSIALTPEEIDKIYRYDLSKDERMETARDKFIVLCETALRVSDYDKISVGLRTVKGRSIIDLYQTKTKNRVLIPLTPRMREILHKYKGQLPSIHEVYVNKYIKHVAYRVGLTEHVRWEETKRGLRIEKCTEKYKLITCHTGRRAGATNMYWAGIPVKIIMSITGHRTEAQLMEYIKVTPEELALEAAKYDYFNGSNLSIAQ